MRPSPPDARITAPRINDCPGVVNRQPLTRMPAQRSPEAAAPVHTVSATTFVKLPNALTGEGNLSVDISFESMDDFSPAAVARKVDALSKLLEARTQLSNLMTFMDGKSGTEELLARVLKDPALLKSLTASAKPEADAPEAGTPETTPEEEKTDG